MGVPYMGVGWLAIKIWYQGFFEKMLQKSDLEKL